MSFKTADTLHIRLIIAFSVAKHLILQILPGFLTSLTQCLLNILRTVYHLSLYCSFTLWSKRHLCMFVFILSTSDVQSGSFWQ